MLQLLSSCAVSTMFLHIVTIRVIKEKKKNYTIIFQINFYQEGYSRGTLGNCRSLLEIPYSLRTLLKRKLHRTYAYEG